MEDKLKNTLQEHEKLIAFLFLGFSVLLLAMTAYFYPPQDKSGAQRIIDAAMGGLLLALGAVCNALFRISNSTEQQAIADKTAAAITAGPPVAVQVQQPIGQPVPVAETDPTSGGELPASERIG